jgi:hypothetical protein
MPLHMPNDLKLLIGLVVVLFLAIFIGVWFSNRTSVHEGFDVNFRSESRYVKQLEAIDKHLSTVKPKVRPVTELLAADTKLPKDEQCLVNFYALATRFTGYLGPFDNGYFDPNIAIERCLKAGIRTFILEIDYAESDTDADGTPRYFPKIVVRDIHGRNRINEASDIPNQTVNNSSIKQVANAISKIAFSSSIDNATDPVIVVLYGLRMPPKKYQLEYMSNIAKCLAPLKDKRIDMLMQGKYARQANESKLLSNKITDYAGRVLIFANMDTTEFRNPPKGKKYEPMEDLDYWVNLRLSYKQKQLGCTCSPASAAYGTLDSAQGYTEIPEDRKDETIRDTTLKWTIALSEDPEKPVPESTYNTAANTFGVQCVPILLWDETNNFMFTKKTFDTYSFIPKPEELRQRKAPIVVPDQPSQEMNANGGKLREPTIARK